MSNQSHSRCLCRIVAPSLPIRISPNPNHSTSAVSPDVPSATLKPSVTACTLALMCEAGSGELSGCLSEESEGRRGDARSPLAEQQGLALPLQLLIGMACVSGTICLVVCIAVCLRVCRSGGVIQVFPQDPDPSKLWAYSESEEEGEEQDARANGPSHQPAPTQDRREVSSVAQAAGISPSASAALSAAPALMGDAGAPSNAPLHKAPPEAVPPMGGDADTTSGRAEPISYAPAAQSVTIGCAPAQVATVGSRAKIAHFTPPAVGRRPLEGRRPSPLVPLSAPLRPSRPRVNSLPQVQRKPPDTGSMRHLP